MIFAAPYLGARGLQADAKGCRQFSDGVGMLAQRRRAGTLPRLSILALGANGPVSAAQIAGALSTVGRDARARPRHAAQVRVHGGRDAPRGAGASRTACC